MGEINVSVGNVSQFMPQIRKLARGKILESVNKPGVRTRINEELYWEFEDTLPYDTGAFHDSPLSASMPSHERVHVTVRKDGMGITKARYAQGKIDDYSITFDPYEIYKNGSENHYASKIRGLNLNDRVRRSTRRKADAIAKIIIQEARDD